MKWILFLLAFFTTQVSAQIITYEMAGYGWNLSTPAPTEPTPITLTFTVDTVNKEWTDLTAIFLGSVWTAEGGSIPTTHSWEGGYMAHWIWFSPVISNGHDVISFSKAPEWKVAHDDPSYDALANLEKSLPWIGVAVLNNREDYGMDYEVISKTVHSVPEPATLALIPLSLLGLYRRRTY